MAACTSAVDYYARPKPSYYAVRGAYAPLLISARFPTQAWEGCEKFEAEAWVCNSYEQSYSDVTLQLRLVGTSGKVYIERAETISFGANCAARLATLQESLDRIPEEVFFLDMQLIDSDSSPLARNRYAFSRTETLAPLLACAATTFSILSSRGESDQILTLTNTGGKAAMFVWLEDACDLNTTGYAYFEDNYFCLFPGEGRTVTVSWVNVPVSERRLDVAGWNTEHILVNLSSQGGA
jgi:beta-mannosidase